MEIQLLGSVQEKICLRLSIETIEMFVDLPH